MDPERARDLKSDPAPARDTSRGASSAAAQVVEVTTAPGRCARAPTHVGRLRGGPGRWRIRLQYTGKGIGILQGVSSIVGRLQRDMEDKCLR